MYIKHLKYRNKLLVYHLQVLISGENKIPLAKLDQKNVPDNQHKLLKYKQKIHGMV